MAYLVQRGNSFHFRIRVPTDLKPVLGKGELRRSLGACNGKWEARRNELDPKDSESSEPSPEEPSDTPSPNTM